MSGFWITKLVNIFSIPHCFLIPLLSDGRNLYFQEIENDKITKFVEISETYFDESTIVSISENRWKQYHVGEEAVYAIQINPGVVFMANSQMLVQYYKGHINDIPKDCSLYEEMQLFIIGMTRKHTRLEIDHLSMLPAAFFSNFKNTFNVRLFWTIHYNSDPLHLLQCLPTELITTRDDAIQIFWQKISRVYSEGLIDQFFLVIPGEREIKIKSDSFTGNLFDTPSGALFSPAGFSETDNIFTFREHVIRDVKNNHFGNNAATVFNSKIKTKIPTSTVLKTLNDIIIPSEKYVNKANGCRQIWTSHEVSAHLSQHEANRVLVKVRSETNSAKPALYLSHYQELEDNAQRIDKWLTEEIADKETSSILQSWGVYITPPVFINQDYQVVGNKNSFWHSYLSMKRECEPYEDFEGYFWVKVDKLYRNIYMLCARNLTTKELFFSIIEGLCTEVHLESFIENLAEEKVCGDQQSITILLLKSTHENIKISDAFSGWAQQHEDRITIIDELKDSNVWMGTP